MSLIFFATQPLTIPKNAFHPISGSVLEETDRVLTGNGPVQVREKFGNIRAVICPRVAASSTERSTAPGCNPIQGKAASFVWKKSDCSQMVPRTQSHRASGRMSDKTLVDGVRSTI